MDGWVDGLTDVADDCDSGNVKKRETILVSTMKRTCSGSNKNSDYDKLKNELVC